MESNKDEALRSFGIAEKYFLADNLVSARKFCLKSISLFKTTQAESLLVKIDAAESSSSSPSSSSTSPSSSDAPKASATEEHPSAAGMKHRHNTAAPQAASSTTANGSSKKRDYTPQQHEVVKRVRACKVTEFYEILALQKDCEEADVKKAYRKLALALHPDKNGAPGADEAFKMVSKAFQILSDPQKRAAYDRSGGDPEDRFGGGGGGSPADFGSFFGGQGGGRSPATFDGEISPEELFNMFFGGGGGGFAGSGTSFAFGGPGVFTASFGPGGFNARRAGGGGTAQDNTPRSLFVQLLPLIILFGFSLLSALPSLFSTPPVPDPHFSFHNTARYSTQRQTMRLGVPYFVNQGEFQKHPVIGAELAREGNKVTSSSTARGPALQKFEERVDHVYTQDLYVRCQRGVDQKNRLKENEIGLFGIGTDWAKVKKIEEERIEECDKLKSLGII